jgi:ribosome recycling factor
MVDPKGGKAMAVWGGASVQSRNTIHIIMEDLAEEDRKELEKELEEKVERQRKKLVCFQKTRHGVINRWTRWLHLELR